MAGLAEEGASLLEAMEEGAADLEKIEEGLGAEIKSSDTVIQETKAEIQKIEDAIQLQEEQAFKEGVKEVTENVEKLKDPIEAAKIKSKWTVKNIWQNAKSFGKFVGIEAAKGALFTAGMEAVQQIAKQIQQKKGNPDDKTALVLANKLAGAAQSLQNILSAWLLWFANHYDSRDEYGSVSVQDTDISRFQIVQNKIADASKVLETKVGPALTTAAKNNNLEAMKGLKGAYVELHAKMAAVSNDISGHEQKMVTDGLEASKTELDAVKATLDAA